MLYDVIRHQWERGNLKCSLEHGGVSMDSNGFHLVSSAQCTPILGHGFVLDKYRCQCRPGFYHPSRVALNGYKGTFPNLARCKNILSKVSAELFIRRFSADRHGFVCLICSFWMGFLGAREVMKPQSKGSWLAFPWKQQRVASESWDLWDLRGL